MNNLKISEVSEGSIAEEAGIEPGDSLVSINGQKINDVFDYRFYSADEEISLEVLKPDGEILAVEIEKDEWEDLGLTFEKPLLDEEKSCRNQCIFCFIDQLPRGMRDSLYYKDDDARLSFLFGNYITMTNMKQDELERIIRYRMSPVNVSVHTTNPELRKYMLNNRFAGDILNQMKQLTDNGITVNTQIVLCRGVNDQLELERTLRDLSGLKPMLNSISVVPVGLTRYRDKLAVLQAFDSASASEVIRQTEAWQRKFLQETGSRTVYLSDEWYLMSGNELPGYEHYEDFPQIENGVGMAAAFIYEFQEALLQEEKRPVHRTVSIATGTLASKIIMDLAKQAEDYFPGLKVFVYPIENEFLGKNVTVSGLLTGSDIQEQLGKKQLGDRLLLPSNMFRAGTELFLDDLTINDLHKALNVPALKVEISGEAFVNALIG